MLKNVFVFLLVSFTTLHGSEFRTYAQFNAAPKFIQSGNTVTGLCVDIMRAIEKEDSQISFVGYSRFAPFARKMIDLESGNIDVIVGIVKNAERAAKFNFIPTPIYTTNDVLVSRADDPVDIRSFDDIRRLGGNGIILTNHGAAHVHFLLNQGGLLIDHGASNTPDNLYKLVQGRGRFVYLNDIELRYDIRKENLESKLRFLKTSFAQFPHYIAFSRRVPLNHRTEVAIALKKLEQKGELMRIFEKYSR
jgi:polar amino acid transport system substrate-binding protein